MSNDPRAYSGSDGFGLTAALRRDNLETPESAQQLRYKTVTTDLGPQFYLTFRQPCAGVQIFLSASGISNVRAPIGDVQPDVAARVGWHLDESQYAIDDVRGASGGVGVGRNFELTVIGNDSTGCVLYYYSTAY